MLPLMTQFADPDTLVGVMSNPMMSIGAVAPIGRDCRPAKCRKGSLMGADIVKVRRSPALKY